MKQGISLAELAAELERQEAVKADYIADTRRMHFTTHFTNPDGGEGGWNSELDLIGEGATEGTSGLVVLPRAHQQIATHLNIPWRFYQRLQGESALHPLLDENVNRLLRHQPTRRMV